MASLKQQIAECEYEIRQRQYAIDQYRLKKQALMQQRADCAHEFTKPIKGYEHEGGECIHCGINEVYAASNKKSMPVCEFCGNPTGGPMPCCNEGAL